MSKNTNDYLKKRASVLALASCVGLSPTLAEAAGLGRITVQSALGQPLRAEIELNATRDELNGMTAKVAAPDAFKLAGIEYASTLSSIKFAIDKRPSGQSIIRVTSERPVGDPFVDMLIELTWPSGRLVREYTFLLDPPEMSAKPAPAVSAPPTRVERVEPTPVPALAAPAPETRPTPARKAAAPTAKVVAAAGPTVEVKRGDNLRKIAGEIQPEGVSLDQMLVGLFRANKEVFDGGNMNRIRAGRILVVPAPEEVAAISQKDAQKEIIAQASDWNAYRRKLAGVAAQAPAADAAGAQAAGGKITAKVDTKTPAEAKDQVKISKTETTPGAPAVAGKAVEDDKLAREKSLKDAQQRLAALEEDKVAKEKSLKEAQERVAALEKNAADLQKMVELKNQSLAAIQKQAATKAPPEAAKTEAAPAAASAKPAEVAKPAEAKPADVKPAEAKPAEAKPADVKPAEAPKPKPKAVIAPPEPEPTFLEEFGGMLAGLGGALAALIGGLVFWKRRQKGAAESPSLALSTLGQPSLDANSVFRATGGQSVDTSNVTPATTDFSQSGPGMMDSDEVDPVAEAEVYMAYGRDAQAEEILLEALQKDSKRLAIHVKLLEIYSNRKSLKQFETLAFELYGLANGTGPEWEKAAAMGLRLDPTNPLYSRGSATAGAAAAVDPEATLIASSSEALRSMATVPASVSPPAEDAVATMPGLNVAASAPEAPAMDASALDFDLGIDTPVATTAGTPAFEFDLGAGAAATPETPAAATDTQESTNREALGDFVSAFTPEDTIGHEEAGRPNAEAASTTMDFKLPDMELAPAAAAPEPVAPIDTAALDFDLGFAATPAPASEAIEIRSLDVPATDFDVRLTDAMIEAPAAKTINLAAINLDLGTADIAAAPDKDTSDQTILAAPAVEAVGDDEAGSQEVATKLDLAKAYEDMGDHEGARELLQEVLAEGNGTQQAAAQAMLAKLG